MRRIATNKYIIRPARNKMADHKKKPEMPQLKKKIGYYIPKSVIRNHLIYVWNELTGMKYSIRIKKKAFNTLHYALEHQLCECLRAAKRMINLSNKHVITASELYLARCLLFANISKQVNRKRVCKAVADNACRALSQACKVSLSKKVNKNPLRPFNTYDEIRRLLLDLIYEITQSIINDHAEDLTLIKESHVTDALRKKGLRKHYLF